MRAYNHLTTHKELSNVGEVEQVNVPAARLLEWADNIITLYRHKMIKKNNIKVIQDTPIIPKANKTSKVTDKNNNWLQHKTEMGFKRNDLTGRENTKKKGAYIKGKTFILTQETGTDTEEGPLTVIKGFGKQTAAIMKYNEKLETPNDSARLEAFLDDLAEHKDT